MSKITLYSHAKINLSLDVSALRGDGFHDIDSVVQIIDIADEMELAVDEPGIIDVTVESGNAPSGPENLVFKACEAFFRTTGIKAGVRVRLWKSIPAQAGLGGGSGNAAAVVAGLNRMFECGLGSAELAGIVSEVGSDTALFIYGGTTCISGRGEVIEPLPDAPELHVVILKPEAGVSTKWAYAEMDRDPQRRKGNGTSRVKQAILDANYNALLAALSNDFDPVISGSVAEIDAAKTLLKNMGAKASLLCGSGSAVYGVFDSHGAAESARQELKSKYESGFVCRSLTRAESALV